MSGALPIRSGRGRHWHVHVRTHDRAARESDHYWTESYRAILLILQTYGVDGSLIQSAEFHFVYTCDGKIHEQDNWQHLTGD